MKVPEELVAKMLGDGETGILASVVCLGAALAVKRGGDTRLLDISDASGRPISNRLKASIVEAHARAVENFRSATPEEVDRAIALSSAHLRAAGYCFTTGRDN